MRAQIEEAGRRRQEYIRANRTPMDSPGWSEKCARKSRCDSHINNTGTLYALSVWARGLSQSGWKPSSGITTVHHDDPSCPDLEDTDQWDGDRKMIYGMLQRRSEMNSPPVPEQRCEIRMGLTESAERRPREQPVASPLRCNTALTESRAVRARASTDLVLGVRACHGLGGYSRDAASQYAPAGRVAASAARAGSLYNGAVERG
ncbi:hypothetical protein C8J57DRAFT_1465465 [Mycena rebaudengoi]|nr:hypothetical protein C8J57DRAFT_1465465 [Mycena rebaudengoi]